MVIIITTQIYILLFYQYSMTKKDISVLVVEDTPLQQDWAKETIGKDVDLTVVPDLLSYEAAVQSRQFDYVITDMFLPEVIDDQSPYFVAEDGFDEHDNYIHSHGTSDFTPKFERGKAIFADGLAGLLQKKHKGVALVSNFEHHADKIERAEFDELLTTKQTYENVIKSFYDAQGHNDWKLNALFFFDEPMTEYNHFLKDEKIVTVNEVERNTETMYGPHVMGLGYTPLKPYKKVLDELMK